MASSSRDVECLLNPVCPAEHAPLALIQCCLFCIATLLPWQALLPVDVKEEFESYNNDTDSDDNATEGEHNMSVLNPAANNQEDETKRGYIEHTLAYAPKMRLIAADFNGDGASDLVLVMANEAEGALPLLLAEPDGVFTVHWHSEIPKPFVDTILAKPDSAIVSDINGDLNVDITVFKSIDDQSVAMSYGDGRWRLDLTAEPKPEPRPEPEPELTTNVTA